MKDEITIARLVAQYDQLSVVENISAKHDETQVQREAEHCDAWEKPANHTQEQKPRQTGAQEPSQGQIRIGFGSQSAKSEACKNRRCAKKGSDDEAGINGDRVVNQRTNADALEEAESR